VAGVGADDMEIVGFDEVVHVSAGETVSVDLGG
jgi:hypothetical protein